MAVFSQMHRNARTGFQIASFRLCSMRSILYIVYCMSGMKNKVATIDVERCVLFGVRLQMQPRKQKSRLHQRGRYHSELGSDSMLFLVLAVESDSLELIPSDRYCSAIIRVRSFFGMPGSPRTFPSHYLRIAEFFKKPVERSVIFR
jgi:hypothetical protein